MHKPRVELDRQQQIYAKHLGSQFAEFFHITNITE